MSESTSGPGPGELAPRSLSVLLPVLNGEPFLERVLAGLEHQECPLAWDFLALDCGSTDRTLEILADFVTRFPVPLQVHGIDRSEFNHGDTRNMLAALSTGDVCVFLTDDAIPVGRDWLATIGQAFEDPAVWALYLRNTPRPEAELLAQSLSSRDPGYAPGRRLTTLPDEDAFERLDAHGRRELFNYNDTTSAIRRSCWERYPYPRCDFGEDVLLARGMIEGGGGVLYEDRAVIHHSHEYGPELTRSRAVEDAEFNVEWLGRVGVRNEEDLEAELAAQLEYDLAFLRTNGVEGDALDVEMVRASELRRAYFEGSLQGSRATRRYSPGAMLPAARFPLVVCGESSGVERLRDRGWSVELVAEAQAVERASATSAALVVVGDPDAAGVVLAAALAAGVPILCLVSPGWARERGMRKVVACAWELGDAARIERPPLARHWGAASTDEAFELLVWHTAEELDELRGPRQRVCEPDEEELLRLEVRLRCVAARARRPRRYLALDERPADTVALEGGARALDDARVLVPGGGAAEWCLERAGRGPRELLLVTEALVEESEDELGGTLLVDGRVVAELGPYRLRARGDEVRCLRVPVDLGSGARRLRLEGRLASGHEVALRIARLAWVDPEQLDDSASTSLRSRDLRGQDGRLTGRRSSAQDCDTVLVGPKVGRVTFDLEGLVPGPHALELWLWFVPEESELEMQGRVLLDGKPVLRFGPVLAPPGGGAVRLDACLDLARATTLAIENKKRPLGRTGFVRVARVVLRPDPSGKPLRGSLLGRWLRLPPRLVT